MALKRSSFTRIGLPLVAGAIFPLGLAPFDLWPFTLLSICLLFLTLNPSKSFFAVGWLYGSGLFLSGASWIYVSINVYGSAPVPLALFLTLCFCLGLALLHGTQALVFRHFGAQTPFWAPVSFAALWVSLNGREVGCLPDSRGCMQVIPPSIARSEDGYRWSGSSVPAF